MLQLGDNGRDKAKKVCSWPRQNRKSSGINRLRVVGETALQLALREVREVFQRGDSAIGGGSRLGASRNKCWARSSASPAKRSTSHRRTCSRTSAGQARFEDAERQTKPLSRPQFCVSEGCRISSATTIRGPNSRIRFGAGDPITLLHRRAFRIGCARRRRRARRRSAGPANGARPAGGADAAGRVVLRKPL